MGRRKYTEEELKNLEDWDLSLMTPEDQEQYGEILKGRPYDWELMNMFYESGRKEAAYKRIQEKHVDWDSETLEKIGTMEGEPLTQIIRDEDKERLRRTLEEAVSPKMLARFVERVDEQETETPAVYRSNLRTRKKLESALKEHYLEEGEKERIMKIENRQKNEMREEVKNAILNGFMNMFCDYVTASAMNRTQAEEGSESEEQDAYMGNALRESEEVPVMITLTDAVNMTGLSRNTLKKMCESGQVAYVRPQRIYYINQDSLKEALRQH